MVTFAEALRASPNRSRLVERSDHYVAIKPVYTNNGLMATLARIPIELVEPKRMQTVGNRIKRETETSRDLKRVLSDYLGCPVKDLSGYNERQLLDLFHENFAGLYCNSSGKNIEIQKYHNAKERAQRDLGESKNVVWRVE